MNSVFSDAIKAAASKGIAPRSKNSINWFRQYIKTHVTKSMKLKDIRAAIPDVIRESNKLTPDKFMIGSMYVFAYDAKHKDTLPYWDASPLIIPIHDDGKTITGINFHYLPLPLRAKLLDALYEFTNNDKMDHTTKLRLTYHMLQAAAKFKYIKPCIKKYLKSNVRSKLIKIHPQHWEIALFLPTATWQKASSDAVYKDSNAIVNARKK